MSQFEASARVFPYMTAYQMLHRTARVQSGETVLMHSAAGRVGTAALELGAVAGLRLFGTASARDRAGHLRRAHTGLKAAIGSVLLGAAWQRCRIHATRNLLAAVPKGHADMAAAAVRTIFAQPGAPGVRSQPGVIAGMLGRQFPKVEATQIAQGTRSRPSTPRTSSKPDRCATTNGQLLAGKTARRSSGGPPTRTWRPWPNKSSA